MGMPQCRRAMLMGMALFFCVACAQQPGKSRAATSTWATARGFQPLRLPTASFELWGLLRLRPGHTDVLTVYIEGDGAPWPSPYHPPADPTPLRATALLLAEVDPSPAVAYLARPGHYPDDNGPGPVRYWSAARFTPEVLQAMNHALSQLKAHAQARSLRLVGFSGGGVLAALLAGERHDVSGYVTIAAPLALQDWLQYHDAAAMPEALDPLRIPLPPGEHWVGLEDDVVPPSIVAAFVARQGGTLRRFPHVDHDCCWTPLWAASLRTAH